MPLGSGRGRVIPAADVTRPCTYCTQSWRVSVSVSLRSLAESVFPLPVKHSTVDATAAEVLGRLKNGYVNLKSSLLNALTR